MNLVQLFKNNVIVHEYTPYELLGVLVSILKQDLEFDYLIIDYYDIVRKSELRSYIRYMNKYCKNVYGFCYDL